MGAGDGGGTRASGRVTMAGTVPTGPAPLSLLETDGDPTQICWVATMSVWMGRVAAGGGFGWRPLQLSSSQACRGCSLGISSVFVGAAGAGECTGVFTDLIIMCQL